MGGTDSPAGNVVGPVLLTRGDERRRGGGCGAFRAPSSQPLRNTPPRDAGERACLP